MRYSPASVALDPRARSSSAPRPHTLPLMHGSSCKGDGASLLRALADALDD
jgi:hypothetical protein